jgi:hypothetical protein
MKRPIRAIGSRAAAILRALYCYDCAGYLSAGGQTFIVGYGRRVRAAQLYHHATMHLE